MCPLFIMKDVREELNNLEKISTFKISNSIEVNRIGFGAMQLLGKGRWGPPKDINAAINVLKHSTNLGVNFIDTADSYGPDVSEKMICETLYPYKDLTIATKAGFVRRGPDMWYINCRPEYLISCVKKSLSNLKLEQIPLWQLHRIDPTVPRADQFGTIKQLLDEGLIACAGLSHVSVSDIKEASTIFPVATVQNRYNIADRQCDDVVDYCTMNNIGFIPYYPLGGRGELTNSGGLLENFAKSKNATSAQIALAWLLKRSKVIIPIPGTSVVTHLEENMSAHNVILTDKEFNMLCSLNTDGTNKAPTKWQGY